MNYKKRHSVCDAQAGQYTTAVMHVAEVELVIYNSNVLSWITSSLIMDTDFFTNI